MPPTLNERIDKMATDLAKGILEKTNSARDVLIYENSSTANQEQKDKKEEECTDFAIDVMKYMANSELPCQFAGLAIDKIINVLDTLKGYITGTIRQHENEYMSRSLGVKDTENGKYRKEECTIGQLILKLSEVRESQGNNNADYFNTPTLEEKPIESPFPVDNPPLNDVADKNSE